MTQALMALDVPCPAAERKADGTDDLVGRLRAGDARALGELYDLHHAHVRAFARRLVGDDGSAEDVVQETFVALPSAIHSFRATASLRSFLVGIAVNHARHHVRAAARRRAAMARMTTEPAVDGAASPEEVAEGAELARELVRALDDLSLEHRAAFVLCEVEERSAGEAAAVLGIPEATVRTRLHHAKKKLREWFTRRARQLGRSTS